MAECTHSSKAVSSAFVESDLVARFLDFAGHHRYHRSHGQSCAMACSCGKAACLAQGRSPNLVSYVLILTGRETVMSATVRDPAPVWPEDRTEDIPKPELRKETRRRVLKGAQIAFKGRGAVIDCMVRDLSDGGACLKVASPIGIPDTFELGSGPIKILA